MGDVSLHRPVQAEPATGGILAQEEINTTPVYDNAALALGLSLNRHAIAQNEGNETADLMSPGWTDERHTLYISSMESSFMDQLYKRGRNANQNDSSAGGFKVLRAGVWETLKFERTNVVAPATAKCRLPENPWIRHFRPRDCSSDTRGDGADTSVGDHESGICTVRGRDPVSHARELGACKPENLVHENTAEVSDQNFADDEAEADAESSKLCKKRRVTVLPLTVPQ